MDDNRRRGTVTPASSQYRQELEKLGKEAANLQHLSGLYGVDFVGAGFSGGVPGISDDSMNLFALVNETIVSAVGTNQGTEDQDIESLVIETGENDEDLEFELTQPLVEEDIRDSELDGIADQLESVDIPAPEASVVEAPSSQVFDESTEAVRIDTGHHEEPLTRTQQKVHDRRDALLALQRDHQLKQAGLTPEQANQILRQPNEPAAHNPYPKRIADNQLGDAEPQVGDEEVTNAYESFADATERFSAATVAAIERATAVLLQAAERLESIEDVIDEAVT